MKNVFKLFGITALVAVIGFSMIALSLTGCDTGGGGDGPGSTTRDAKTYTGTAGDGSTYMLKIEDPSRAALTPAKGDNYTLTSGGKTSTGTVNSFTNNVLDLTPSNAQSATFTVTVTSSGGISQMTGTITWSDNTTAPAPTFTSGGGGGGKNLSPKTYLGRGSNQDSLEFTSATNVTYRNVGRSINVQGTYTVSGNTVTTTFQYQGETEIWTCTLGNNDDTLTVQSASGNFKPNVGYVFVNKAANVSAFAGTWNASGGRSCTFTGNNFDYKVNGTTQYSGSFYAAGSTIIFVVSAGALSGNYTLSGNTLTLSNMGSDVDGTYTKGGSSGSSSITASDLILPNGQAWVATHSSGNVEGWVFKANGDLDHLYISGIDNAWHYGEQWKWELSGTTLTFRQRDGSGDPWSYANLAKNGTTLTMDNYTAVAQEVTIVPGDPVGLGGTYVITGSGTSFKAINGTTTITENKPIADVIDAIRNRAYGQDCTIQFGDGAVLNIGGGIVTLNTSWGMVNLTGKITSSNTNYTIYLQGTGLTVTSTADIANTYTSGASVRNHGALTIDGGTVTSPNGVQNYGTLTINNVTINASNEGLGNNSGGTATINGGTIKGSSRAVNNYDATFNMTGGTIDGTERGLFNSGNTGGTSNITGGTVKGGTHAIYKYNGTVTVGQNATIDGPTYGI